MSNLHFCIPSIRRIASAIATLSLLAIAIPNASAAVSFLGVAAGDASSNHVTLWTRTVDSAAPANIALTLQITTDPAFSVGISQLPNICTTDSNKHYVCKVEVGGIVTPRSAGPTIELQRGHYL